MRQLTRQENWRILEIWFKEMGQSEPIPLTFMSGFAAGLEYQQVELDRLGAENARLRTTIAAWKKSAKRHRGNQLRKQKYLVEAVADLDNLLAENARLREACQAALWELQGHLEKGTAKPILEDILKSA